MHCTVVFGAIKQSPIQSGEEDGLWLWRLFNKFGEKGDSSIFSLPLDWLSSRKDIFGVTRAPLIIISSWVEKFQLSVQNLNNLWTFIEVYAVFAPNLCGEKSVQRRYMWRKWQIWGLWCNAYAVPKLSKGVRKSCQVLPKQCPSHPQVIPKLSPGSAQDVPKSPLVMPSRTHEATMKPAHRVQWLPLYSIIAFI